MTKIEVTGNTMNKVSIAYYYTDYFGYDDDFKVIIKENNNFKIISNNVDVVTKPPDNRYNLVLWRDAANIILEFENEEDALYFQLKYC